jgi:hypothetical protein
MLSRVSPPDHQHRFGSTEENRLSEVTRGVGVATRLPVEEAAKRLGSLTPWKPGVVGAEEVYISWCIW